MEEGLNLNNNFVEKIPNIHDNREGGYNSPWFLWDQPVEELVSKSMVKHWGECHEDYTIHQSLQDFSA
eukprot:10229670-Ditylum_brightwellii.AAC.1